MEKWAKWQRRGAVITVLGLLIYIAGLAIATHGPVREILESHPAVRYVFWGMIPVGVFMIIAGFASLCYCRYRIKQFWEEAVRVFEQRTPVALLGGNGPPIDTDGLLSLYGDFNNIQRGDYDYLFVYPRDLKRFRNQLKPGLRVHLSDGELESVGILELVGNEWRARILWETVRDVEDE